VTRYVRASLGIGGSLIVLSVLVGGCLTPQPLSGQRRGAHSEVDSATSRISGQLPSEWAPQQDSGSSGALKGALIGTVFGAFVGLIGFDIAHDQLGICDPSSPTCTVYPTKTHFVITGAALGLVVGAALGSTLGSSQDWTPMPRIGLDPEGGWAMSVSVPYGP
jgi:hypothetical protein